MRAIAALALCVLLAPASHSQAKPAAKPSAAPTAADRLGKTCAQILRMTSTEWVAQYKEKVASPEVVVRALGVYGQCYDARTNRLAASLAKTGKGPLMGARGNFQDFEKALDDFTAKALAAMNPSAGSEISAYAALYAKQFRYKFYRSYETRQFHVEPTPEDLDALGLAKNHFGELLNALPEDKMRGVHAAFGHIFGGSPLAEEWRLEIYRYAISILEPPSAAPFAPPPF
jgi:hypothetical protein